MRKPRSFSHPLSTRCDERIAALIAERGHAGYGLYWMLIEIIHREHEMRIYYTGHRIRRLSAIFGITSEAFKTFVEDLIYTYELLTLEEDYLMSAITYRRPRKPKPTPPTETNTEPTATQQQPSVTATPPQEHRNDTTTAAQQHHYSSITAARSTIIPPSTQHHPIVVQQFSRDSRKRFPPVPG